MVAPIPQFNPYMMHAESRKVFLSLLRRFNKYIGQRKIETFFFENVQKSPGFFSENPWGLSGNGVFPRALAPLHLQTGFRFFTVISQDSRDEDFSELDAREMKEDEGFKDVITNKAPSLASIFSYQGFKDVITNKAPSLASIFSYQDVKKSVKSVASVPSEKHEKKSVQSATFIPSEIKETKSMKPVPYISSKETEKKNVKSEHQQMTTPKTEKKTEGVSDIMEHPWPEWVQFLEHLNERGYLSKAFHFQGPIVLQGLSTEGIYAFIEFAAFSFAKDHIEISKFSQCCTRSHVFIKHGSPNFYLLRLSGSDLKKVALHCCPSVEKRVAFAAKKLHSFYSTENDVSKAKRIELEDVVRLLCAYGLNAEKSELPIPDDIKRSVVNLLKELVDISASSMNDG